MGLSREAIATGNRSFADCVQYVLPIVEREGVLAGKIVPKRRDPNGMRDEQMIFDADAFEFLYSPMMTKTVSSRVQWVEKERLYKSYTVRVTNTEGKASELTRLVKAHETGIIKPDYVMQAYLDISTKEVLAIGLMETKEFVDLAMVMKVPNGKIINNGDGSSFVPVYWASLQHNKAKTLWVYKAEDTKQGRFF